MTTKSRVVEDRSKTELRLQQQKQLCCQWLHVVCVVHRSDNNNNNNNKHDNVYGAVIMAEPLQEFTRFI